MKVAFFTEIKTIKILLVKKLFLKKVFAVKEYLK